MWLREMDNAELMKTMAKGKTFEIEGASPDVPFYKCSGIVTVKLVTRSHVLYMDEVHLEIKKVDYEEWIKNLSI